MVLLPASVSGYANEIQDAVDNIRYTCTVDSCTDSCLSPSVWLCLFRNSSLY